MSDIIPTDPAIDLIRKRRLQIEARIEARITENAADELLCNELTALIDALTPKRPRKPRAVNEAPANDSAEENAPRPTVFATPSVESGDTAEAA